MELEERCHRCGVHTSFPLLAKLNLPPSCWSPIHSILPVKATAPCCFEDCGVCDSAILTSSRDLGLRAGIWKMACAMLLRFASHLPHQESCHRKLATPSSSFHSADGGWLLPVALPSSRASQKVKDRSFGRDFSTELCKRDEVHLSKRCEVSKVFFWHYFYSLYHS